MSNKTLKEFSKDFDNRLSEGIKVYVAGPMAGIDNFNYPEFFKESQDLFRSDYIPVLPIDEGDLDENGNQTMTFGEYLRKDIKKLLDCDAVVMLGGWSNSRGATLEAMIASAIGMPVFRASDKTQIHKREIVASFFAVHIKSVLQEIADISINLKGRYDKEPEKEENKLDTILEEAEYIVTGDRQRDYGSPSKNHGRTAKLWSVYLNTDITAEQVCMLNVLQKIARSMNKLTRDTLVDISGYARNIEIIHDENR